MTIRQRVRFRRREDRESGSATFILIGWAFVSWLLLAVVVDVSLAISQRERAADLADQAARAEAQAVSVGDLRTGGGLTLLNDQCVRAGEYITDPQVAQSVHFGSASLNTNYGNEGANGSADGCQLGPGQSVSVSVNLTYTPLIYDIFGTGTVTVTETGTAIVQAGTN